MSIKSKIAGQLGKAWKAAKTGNITPSWSDLKNNLKYELNYSTKTGKMVGDLTKGSLPKPNTL